MADEQDPPLTANEPPAALAIACIAWQARHLSDFVMGPARHDTACNLTALR